MPKEYLVELPFPIGGLVEHTALHNQPDLTTVDALNVRPHDPATDRLRGAQRPGLSKFSSAQSTEAAPAIQDINYLITPRANLGLNRTVTRLVVSNGSVKLLTSSTMADVTGGTSVLDPNIFNIQSQEAYQDIWYVDGAAYVQYDSSTSTAQTWTPTDGSLPISGTTKARLIALWRGRIVLSGVSGDPHNWFMSKQGDPLNWDYAPASTTVQDAIAGNNSFAGLVGDKVTGLIPYSDDTLLFGADHSIHQMTGDPLAGGQIDRITDTVGMAWGRAWAKDPDGAIYFAGSLGGIYRMAPGNLPQSITDGRIKQKLEEIDHSTNIIRLAYDFRHRGLNVFVTPSTAVATNHYFWDQRTDSWWEDKFDSTDFDPVSVVQFDADDPDDRLLMLGCRDGYVREIDPGVKTDDGTIIKSHVYLGPVKLPGQGKFSLRELQAVLATTSDPVEYAVFAGNSPAEAYDAADPIFEGCWNRQGRSLSERRRAQGHAMYLKLFNDCISGRHWTVESVMARIRSTGPVRQRSLVA